MKITKQQWIIIGVIIVIVIWYFFLRKKKAESSYRTSMPNCPPGTTWKSWCPCCVPDSSESNFRWPVG